MKGVSKRKNVLPFVGLFILFVFWSLRSPSSPFSSPSYIQKGQQQIGFPNWMQPAGSAEGVRGQPIYVDETGELLVGMLTAPQYHRSRAKVSMDTWGRFFRSIFIYSDVEDPTLKTFPVNKLANEKWPKSGAWKNLPMLKDMYTREPHMKWYLIVDDDTFILAQSFIRLLRTLDHSKDQYIGQLNWDSLRREHLFVQGGGGILMSNSLVRKLMPTIDVCNQKYTHVWAGDIRLGYCVRDLQVTKPMWHYDFHGDHVPYILTQKYAKHKPGSHPVTFSHVTMVSMHALDSIVAKTRDGAVTYDDLRRIFPESADPKNAQRRRLHSYPPSHS